MKKHLRSFAAAALLLLPAAYASAQDYAAGGITVSRPWSRSTVLGQTTGGGFFTITNKGADDRLLSIRSPISATAEVHTMEVDKGGVMRMREVDGVDVATGKRVDFSPGGYHVMFMKLKAPLKAGTTFPATLVFQKAGEVKVDFKVEAAAPGGAMAPAGGMSKDMPHGAMSGHMH